MAKPLRPFVRGGGYYPSKKWIPLVKNGGYTTQNGGETEPVWATASGAIASFTTPFAYPLKKLVAQINPVQDLHGQPSPWPAGGGKNIYDLDGVLESGGATYTKSGNVYTITANVALFTQPFTFSDTDIEVTISYTDFDDITSTNIRFDILDANGALVTAIGKNSSPATVTGSKIRFDWSTSGQFTVGNVQIEKGSTASAWTPYSNICPIAGHTGLSVEVRGKNLLPNKIYKENSYRMQLGIASMSEYVKLPAGTYKVSVGYASGVTAGSIFWRAGTDPHESDIITLDKDSDSIRIWIFKDGLQVSDVLWWQVELGSTATTYEPYTSGTTTPVSWQDEAGTVYGGTLDVVSGLLTVDRICHTYKGGTDTVISSRSYDQNNNCMSIRAGSYPHATTDNGSGTLTVIKPMCDKLPTVTFYDISSASQGFAGQGNWAPAVAMKVQGCSTNEEYDAWCLANEPQISWILATPQTYQLTPQEVDTLVGQNNIWVTSGDVEVTYRIE